MQQSVKDPDNLPGPSAELVLWRVSVECFIAVVGRRKANLFLRMMTEKLASEESLASVIQFRRTAEESEVRRARTQAITLWQRYLPTFLARVPRE